LWHFFHTCERAEADDGYFGQADKIKFQQNVVNPKEKRAMQGRVRAFHEMLNGLLKNWGILSQVFCRHISLHGEMRSGRARW